MLFRSPQFSRLPQEIQLIIWETAFNLTPSGRALLPTMSKLRGTTLDLYGALPKWDLTDRASLTATDQARGTLLEIEGKGLFFPLRFEIPNLIAACRSSRIVILERIKLGLQIYGPYVMNAGDRAPHERKMKTYYEAAMHVIDEALEKMRRPSECQRQPATRSESCSFGANSVL